jgi:plasmid stabilization system protein ParE
LRVIFAPAARDDLRRIRDYIGQFNPAAAERVALGLIAAADSLTMYPERGRPIGSRRRELVALWPYVIRYRVDEGLVVVLRVRHGMQRPENG